MENQKQNSLSDFKLLYDNILIIPLELEQTDGVIDPMGYDDKPEYGVVVAVGTGKILNNGTVIDIGVKPKDIVFFGKYSTIKTRDEGVDYYIVKSEDIIAVQNNA